MTTDSDLTRAFEHADNDPQSFGDELQKQQVLQALFPAKPPRTIGRFEVESVLGRGGMGTVYRAFDPRLRRALAIKVLRHRRGSSDERRLRREANALAQVSHENVVQVFEVGQVEGRTYLAMELLEGKTLAQWLEQRPRPDWRRCVEVYLQVCAGLQAAHARGLVHRDFKPANAMIDPAGRVRVLDFGLVRAAGDDDSQTESGHGDDSWPSSPHFEAALTRDGVVMGTPAYMSPEQTRGGNVGPRSDQFAVCAALYEAVFAQRPFAGEDYGSLVAAVRGGKLRPPPPGHTVPPRVRAVLVRGLRADPAQRWPSMDALATALARTLAPSRLRAPLFAAGLGGLALLAAALPSTTPTTHPCEREHAPLAGVWDDARRERVQQTMLALDAGYAADTYDRVAQRADDYATRWREHYDALCDARVHEPTPAVERSLRCLGDRRDELRRAVDLLQTANESRARRALVMFDGLRPAADCEDDRAAEPPAPPDRATATKVDSLRARLHHARLLEKLGEYENAFEVADATTEAARHLDYPPLLAEALVIRGAVQYRLRHLDRSERDLEYAYALATERSLDEVAREAAERLTYLVGYDRGRYEDAARWGRTALALSSGDEQRARAMQNIGTVLSQQGRYEEALATHRETRELRLSAGAPDRRGLASTEHSIGADLFHLRRHSEALPHFARAAELWEGVLGPEHPDLCLALNSLGSANMTLGYSERGTAYFARVVKIWESSLPENDPKLATAYNNLGHAHARAGDTERGLYYFARVAEVLADAEQSNPSFAADLLVSVGRGAANLDRTDIGRRYVEDALRRLELAQAPRGIRADAYFTLAQILGDSPSDRARAIKACTQALDLVADDPLAAKARNDMKEWLAMHPPRPG